MCVKVSCKFIYLKLLCKSKETYFTNNHKMTLLAQRLYISRRIWRRYLTPSSTISARMIEIISVPIICLRFRRQNVFAFKNTISFRKIMMRTRFKMTRQECKFCITTQNVKIVWSCKGYKGSVVRRYSLYTVTIFDERSCPCYLVIQGSCLFVCLLS